MATCKYELEAGKFCKEKIYSSSDYCILHTDFPIDYTSAKFKEILQKKEEKVKEKLKKGDFNFRGAKLHKVDFFNITAKDLDFLKAKIYGNANFGGSHLLGYSNFGEIKVQGNLNLASTKNKGIINLVNAEINGNLHFSLAKVEKDKEYDLGEVSVKEAKIKGIVDFYSAEIDGILDFTLTRIYDQARFIDMTVNEHVIFGGARFDDNLYFIRSKIGLAKNHNECHNFNRIKVYGDADFSNIELNIKTGFEESSFLGSGIFEGFKKIKISFKDARLKNIYFKDCDLSEVSFRHAILENCKLSTSNWENNEIPEYKKYMTNKENAMPKSYFLKFKPKILFKLSNFLKINWINSLIEEASVVANTYAQIKQSLQAEGAYNEAGAFYIKEMDIRREIYWNKNKKEWFFYSLLSISSRYGESSFRVIAVFFAMVIISTFYYWIFDSITVQGTNNTILNNTLLNSFYYSAATSVTLSYSYLQPKIGFPVFFSLFEATLGTFLVALFVYVFARTMSR